MTRDLHNGQSVSDPFDPSKDICQNCRHARSEHKMTRGGPVCASGRRFKMDTEAVLRLLAGPPPSGDDHGPDA